MILDLFYVALIIFAVIAVQTGVLRNAVIFLSVFSLICSIVYLFLGAPDVAIAEAVIGCTLSTILYLVALKKYRIFTVYYNSTTKEPDDIIYLKDERERLKYGITKFASSHELQLDIINTSSGYKYLTQNVPYDVIIFHTVNGIWIHGIKNSYQYMTLVEHLEKTVDLEMYFNYIDEDEYWPLEGEVVDPGES